ncbi:hypothetical protein [Bradyrhizobium sp.]|uniref:hypothetical protein n=1 Tax=Bradyrhizobium sp. TaxID=376 RepID=UPI003C41B777
MRLKLITLIAVTVLAAFAAPAAAASGHHHAQVKHRTAVNARFRDSNAYVAPIGQSFTVRSSRPDYDEGAMTSGMAGH